MKNIYLIFLLILSSAFAICQPIEKEFRIDKQYLNIPIDMDQERQDVQFMLKKDTLTYAVIRIANGTPDYWVFKDVSEYRGKKLKLLFGEQVKGIDKIYLSDTFAGQDSLYREINRPQFHFSPRRGWNNDPNGLVYHNGEYHLYFQHNPYEIHWQNMHWGHAVSKDLLHWEELGDVLYPDELGTMFSGSAIIDKKNVAGWGEDALVAFYTAANGEDQTQCVAYSNDNGRTFTKYEGNPILGPKRDPKVFWYEPANVWVMVLYEDQSMAIYNSQDLKKWEYKSRTKGYYECPELFELAVDGDENNKKWVMYGASGTYMIGDFDGAKFTPEYGKYYYSWGSQYAAQTYNNVPDGRRIQIGWGRIQHKGMPFNQMMLFPTELSLRSTPEGVRLFCEPIEEIEKLHTEGASWTDLSVEGANSKLAEFSSDLYHLKMDIEIEHRFTFKINFRGNDILHYDGNFNRFNGAPYICDSPGNFRFNIEMLIDKTSMEAYLGKGKLFISEQLKEDQTGDGLKIFGVVKLHSLEVHELKSIWE
jgi:sucrose-6-phosphate hydrolase SacC (GH32 family)